MSWVETIRKIVHADAWQNALTALGTMTDKLRNHRPAARSFLSSEYLDCLMYQDGMGRRIIVALPRAALSRWWSPVCEAEGLDGDEKTTWQKRVKKELVRLHAKDALLRADVWGRQKGRGAILIGADDGKPAKEPLDWRRVRSVRFFDDLESDEFSYATIEQDPMAAGCGEPRTWWVTRDGSATSVETHTSRLILVGGDLTSRRVRAMLGYADASALEAPYDSLQCFDSDHASASHMMTDASQFVMAIKGFLDVCASNDAESFSNRIEMIRQARSVASILPIDADDERAEYAERSFAGVSQLLQDDANVLAGTVGYPATVLMGRAPAGMNATGESDLTVWYDLVDDHRGNVLTEPAETLTRLAAISVGAPEPESWTVTWPPLWQMNAAEKAEHRLKLAQMYAAYIQAQVLLPEEVAIALAGDDPDELPKIDVELRQRFLEAELEKQEKAADDPVPPAAPPGQPPTPGAIPPQLAENAAKMAAVAKGQPTEKPEDKPEEA